MAVMNQTKTRVPEIFPVLWATECDARVLHVKEKEIAAERSD